MILYTLKTNECLQALLKAFSRDGNRFWMHASISIEKVNSVFPKLVSKYNLGENPQERQNSLRAGKPTWTLIVYYNPREVGFIQFYLLTTGFRNTPRGKKITDEELETLNKDLLKKENLKDIYTKNPNDLLKVKEFVLGQYVEYKGLKSHFNKEYIYPERYGVVISPKEIKTLNKKGEVLSLKSIDHSDNAVEFRSPLLENEDQKYIDLRKNFGFIFYTEDYKKMSSKYTKEEVINTLKKQFGIKLPPDTEYNEAMKLLFKKFETANRRYLHVFKNNSKKDVVFTWYLSSDFIEEFKHEVLEKIKRIPRQPQAFEEAMQRLYARGNFNGVRHQIGKMNATLRNYVRKLYPKIYETLTLPTQLHYVRFSPKSFENFKEFQQACINETILLDKKRILREINQKRYRKLRTSLREKDPSLKNSTPYTLNRLIKQFDNKGKDEITVTDEDINEFLAHHTNMNPDLLSNLF